MKPAQTICQHLRSLLLKPAAQERIYGLDQSVLAPLATAIARADTDPSRPFTLIASGTEQDLLPAVAALLSGRPLLVLDARREHALIQEAISVAGAMPPGIPVPAGDGPLLDPEPESPALLVSTSGTTGSGRLWSRSQSALLRQAKLQAKTVADGQGKTYAHLGNFQTTAAINSLALALTAGANYRYLPIGGRDDENVLAMLEDTAPTFLTCTPTLFRALGRAGKLNWPLHGVWLVGEKVRGADLDNFRAATAEETALWVRYGSTETGNMATTRLDTLRTPYPNPLPSGFPSDGVELRLVDEQGKSVATGVPGRILVRSQNQARPVGHDPAARFLALDDAAPFFDTGDDGYLAGDGQLYVLGRRDGALKFRGERLDGNALEALVESLDAVEQAAFLTAPGPGGGEVLAVAITGQNTRAIRQVRELLAGRSGVERRATVVNVGAFPRTAAQKVDRRALRRQVGNWLTCYLDGDPPRTPAEKLVADCWAEALGMETPPRDIAFEELGGDSLALVSVIVQLEREYGFTLPDQAMERCRTVATQAAALRPRDQRGSELLVHLGGEGDRILVCCPGIGGHSWSFGPLARTLGDGLAVYGLVWHQAPPEELAGQVVAAARGREIICLGYSGGARSAWLLAEHCLDVGAGLQRVLVLDGSTRQRLGRRHLLRAFRRLLRPRSAADRYLLGLSYAGRRWQLGKSLRPLPLELWEIRCEQTTGEAGVSAWSGLADSHLQYSVPHDHYRLLRPPVPEDVLAIIRAASGLVPAKAPGAPPS